MADKTKPEGWNIPPKPSVEVKLIECQNGVYDVGLLIPVEPQSSPTPKKKHTHFWTSVAMFTNKDEAQSLESQLRFAFEGLTGIGINVYAHLIPGRADQWEY